MVLLIPSYRGAAVIASLLHLGIATADPSSASSRIQAKMDFYTSMQEATRNERREQLRRKAEARMTERVLSKAVLMPASNAEAGVVAEEPDFLRDAAADSPRAFVSRRQYPERQPQSPRRLDDEEYEWENFGFDPSNFSIKYTGCSAIAMYSDELAEDEDSLSVLQTQKFVVFRLCPSTYCNDNSENGCGNNYGEYLIPLGDYLESYSQFKEDLFEAYCEYCEQCLYFENYFYGHRERKRRRLDDADADDGADDADADAAEDVQQDENHACKYYKQCKEYLYSCDYDQWAELNGYNDDNNGNNNNNNNNQVDFQQYFECAQVNYGNYAYYVGPMCGEDSSIVFGIFDDAYCTNYIGKKVDISTVTGVDFTSEEASLSFYSSKDCISCLESDIPYMIVKRDANDQYQITELCESLYASSAKCNKRLWNAEEGSYQSYNQMANENLVCSFIENVINGAYDDKGYIVIDSDEYDQSKLFSVQEISKASIKQIFGVLVVVVGCASLVVWSCFLHRALQQQAKLAILPPEQEFARQESGVMVGRSMSREFPENPENDHVLT